MSLLQEMQLYFKGERNTGFSLLLLAFLLLFVVFYLWKIYKEPLGFGLMIPLTFLILAGFLAAPMLVKTSIKRNERFTALLAKNKAGFLKEETTRMQKVNKNWSRLKLLWASFILLSLAVVFFWKKEFGVGLALGVLLFSSTFLILDTFAEKRAERYTHALQQPPAS